MNLLDIGSKPRLGMHVTHACNRRCKFCGHFADYNFSWMLTPAEAERQMALWSSRIEVRIFVLYGGEPTLNPDLPEIVRVASRHWPRIRLTTNGARLAERAKELLKALLWARHAEVIVSVYDDEDAPEALTRAWRRAGIAASCVRRARKERRSTTTGATVEAWVQHYRGSGAGIVPWNDGNPEESWRLCCAMPQLLDGRIYKCAHVAYLPLLREKFPLAAAWQPILDYKPLDATASDDEVRTFFACKAESVCGLCPAHPTAARP